MINDKTELIGITTIEAIEENLLNNNKLIDDTDIFFIRRKNPSIKHITKLEVNFNVDDYVIKTIGNEKFLYITGSKLYTITYINESNKLSTFLKNYPLDIVINLPNVMKKYILYLIDASIFAVEKRIIKVKLHFLISYSTDDNPSDYEEIDDFKEPIDDIPINDIPINNITEIMNIDEEYM